MAISVVSPTAQKPKHHITLTDGTTTVGLIAVKTGVTKDNETIVIQDENSIVVGPSQPLAIQTTQGDSAYSDREWPYMTLVQSDWSSGRGGEIFEDDKSRYYDADRLNSWREGELLLGPMETYVDTGNEETYMPGDTASSGVTASNLYGATRYWSTTWTQDGSWTCDEIVEIGVRMIGSPGTLTVRLASDSVGTPGDPGVTLISGTETGSSLEAGEDYWLQITMNSTQALTDTVVYHIEAYGAGTDDADNYWQIGTATGTTGGQYSAAGVGTAYTASQLTIYYRILEAYGASTKTQTAVVPFEYKGALYGYTQPPTGNSFLYISGDRGVADSNTGNLDRLVDASKTWADDLYNGCIVKIIAGPGSEEGKAWRDITDTVNNTNNPYLEVTPDWNVEHTTDTEYVIVKTNTYRVLTDLGGYVTDHAVTEDYIYFARGETNSKMILRYYWYNNAGVEAVAPDDELIDGKYLLSIHHPENEYDTLYIAKNAHPLYGTAVGKMRIPGTWDDLVYQMGQLTSTNTPWTDSTHASITNTTDDHSTYISIAAGFTTGIAATKELSSPVDITSANRIGFWVKSSKTCAAGALQLFLNDFSGNEAAPIVIYYDNGTLSYEGAACDGDDDSNFAFTWIGAEDKMYIGHTAKFDTIYFNYGTDNDVADRTLTAEYYDGWQWTALTITDNTKVFDDPTWRTFAVDGTVTFTPPQDWALYTTIIDTVEYSGYPIRLIISGDLTVSVTLHQTYVTRATQHILNFPALVANEWKYAVIAMVPENYPLPDDSAIDRIRVNVVTDNAAQNIWIRGGIDLLYDEPEWQPLPSNENITNMIAHNGNVNEPRTNPWIFTEGAQLYEMQSQNDDQFIPVTIGEMGAFKSENTGAAACVNDVYIYFSLGEEKIERWFNNSLDDVGPDGGFYYGSNV